MKISAIMTPCPYKVSAGESLQKAKEMMDLYSIRHLPVTEDGELLGVLTYSEMKLLTIVCQTAGYCPTVGELAFENTYVVSEHDDLSTVALTMAEKHLECALVEGENSELLGLVTTTDLCRAVHLLLDKG